MDRSFECWPKGVFRNLSYPEIPVYEILQSSARQWPERNAIIFAGMEMTYAELDQLSDRFAAALVDMGIGKGDRVAIHLPNCPQFVISYFGLLKTGAVFVPISPLLSEHEFTFQLQETGAETYIGLDLLYAMPQAALLETKVKNRILVSLADCFPPVAASVKMLTKQPFPEGVLDFIELLGAYPPEPPHVEFNVKEDLAHLIFTGGTTGTPKAVMITHFNVVASTSQMGCWLMGGEVTWVDGRLRLRRAEGDSEKDHPCSVSGEVALIVVPLFHVTGLASFLMQVAYGETSVLFPRFDPAEFLSAIPKHRATAFGGAPQLFVFLVENPLFPQVDMSEIGLVVSGAAPIPQHLLESLLEKVPGVVCEVYGLTETTSLATMNPCSREGLRLGSVGLPIADTEVRIVDPDDYRSELPLGEVGEICIRGPQIMKGYWNRQEETAEVLKEGWLLTGDIGRFDEDGYLYLVDRKKDMLIYKGYNIYPCDLEDVLNSHPSVAQSAVVGKLNKLGELPIAYVQLVSGSSVTEAELLEYANSQLAAYKKIRMLKVVEQLPVTLVGKVLRQELREQAQSLQIGGS